MEGKGCTPTGGQSDVARSDCEHAQYNIQASWGMPCIVILSMGAVTLGDNTCAMCHACLLSQYVTLSMVLYYTEHAQCHIMWLCSRAQYMYGVSRACARSPYVIVLTRAPCTRDDHFLARTSKYSPVAWMMSWMTSLACLTSSWACDVACDVTDVQQIGIGVLFMPIFEFFKSDHY